MSEVFGVGGSQTPIKRVLHSVLSGLQSCCCRCALQLRYMPNISGFSHLLGSHEKYSSYAGKSMIVQLLEDELITDFV